MKSLANISLATPIQERETGEGRSMKIHHDKKITSVIFFSFLVTKVRASVIQETDSST